MRSEPSMVKFRYTISFESMEKMITCALSQIKEEWVCRD